MTSFRGWELKEIHHVLGMSDIVELCHALCLTPGHSWNVSLFLSAFYLGLHHCWG